MILWALACGQVRRDEPHVLNQQPDFPSIDDHIDDRKDPTVGSGGAALGSGGASASGGTSNSAAGGTAAGAGGSTGDGDGDGEGGALGGMGGEAWGGGLSF